MREEEYQKALKDRQTEINGVAYDIISQPSGFCDDCAFYVFDEADRLIPCPSPAKRFCMKGNILKIK